MPINPVDFMVFTTQKTTGHTYIIFNMILLSDNQISNVVFDFILIENEGEFG